MLKNRVSAFTFIILSEIILALIYICITNYSNDNPPLRINEICSGNNTIIYDKKGNFCDYVEFYNTTDDTIDLSDYYLSDTSWHLRKYQLADMSIEPKSYRIVFVNKKNAGFEIGNDEKIYLSNRYGGIIDMVPVPDIASDMVYALNEESDEWIINQIPTPNAANNSVDIQELSVEYDVQVSLSHESGFYDEPFYLEMNTIPGYDIYYTVDGSVPTVGSIRYETPILVQDATINENVYSMRTDISVDEVVAPNYLVDKCNVIRAVAISKDGTMGEERIASYFVGYSERYGFEDICIISLTSDPDNLFSSDRGIYVTGDMAEWNQEENASLNPNMAFVNYTREGNGWRRPAYIEIFDQNGSSVLTEEIDIGIHGGFSTIYPQKGFNLLTSKDRKGDYTFKLGDGKEYTSMMLRPGGLNDWKVTQFRDILNQKLIEDRELTVLNGIPCQVFLDGEYWGLYNLQERIDRGLIAKAFDIDINNLIVAKTNQVVEGNDKLYNQYETILDYAQKADLSNDFFYNQIAAMIDIQSFIDYNCFEIYVANCDTITNNYACWRTKEMTDSPYCDGKWRWIIYDTDDSTGMIEGMTTAEVDSFSAGHWNATPMEEPLLSALLENDSFKKQFVRTFVDMANIDFDYVHVEELIDGYCDEYMKAAVISRHRYGEIDYTEEEYLAGVQVVRDFFGQRRDYILGYLKSNLGIDDLEEYLN